jgi:membrane associated rhomboid family serine protease
MITASVGFQCPECAKEGAKKSRTIDPTRLLASTPYVTYTLFALNVLVFIIGSISDRSLNVGGQGLPFEVRWGQFNLAIAHGEWYRLITAGFIHFGPIHIAFNMYALWILGRALEGSLGRGRYLLIYMVALVGGSLGAVIVDGNGLSAGASGAIFGLFGVLAVLEMLRGQNPLKSQIGSVIIMNLILTVFLHFSLGAHVGGLVIGGAAAGILFGGKNLRDQSSGERQARAVAVAAVGVLCFVVAIALAKANTSIG